MAAFVRELSGALDRADSGAHTVSFACIGDVWPELSGPAQAFGARSFLEEYRIDNGAIGSWCNDQGVDMLLCPGIQASRTKGKTVWWPLTVAPFEAIAVNQLVDGLESRIKWQLMRRSLSLSAALSDHVVFSSNYARALYRSGVASLAEKPTTVIPPSTSIAIRPGVPSHPKYLLSVSNFNRYKFLLEIIEGFSSSSLRADGWRLKLAGRFPDSAYEQEVRHLIDRRSLHGQVEILGEVVPDALPQLYAEASGYIFASVSENAASYTVIDALAYGLPTISSFYSSTPEIVENAVHYVDPFSSASISDGLDLLRDPAQRRRLRQSALAQADGFPSWMDTAQSLLEVGRACALS